MDKMTDTGFATLQYGDKSLKLPILKGTVGPDVIDVRKLYADSDAFTFDPGFTSTASCQSALTYIDGDAGVLLHRGYPIAELAEQSSYLEVCYLLLNGELPNAAQFAEFESNITHHTMLHDQFDRFFQGFRRDAHPMAILTGAVGALSAFYHDSLDTSDERQRMISAHRLIAKLPTIAARAYKYSVGQPFVSPRNDMGYAENFLRMCFAVPAEDWKPNPILSQAMDKIFILHADHDPARRPRAECLDLHRPHGRLDGGQSIRLYRRGHRRPVGPGARRGQRRSAEHAARDRHGRQDSLNLSRALRTVSTS